MSKRRQNFIDSTVQGQLVRRVLFHWTAFFVVLMMTVVFMQMLMGAPEKSITERITEPFREYLMLGLIMVSLLPAFMLDTIRFSNRFVGPVARLRKSLRELATGKAAPLKFRDNDFWSEAASEFNEVAQQMQDLRDQVEALEKQNKANSAVTSSS